MRFVFSSIPQGIATAWVRHLEPALEKRILGEVSVSFVSSSEMRRLNLLYRGKHAPTDVLSFRLQDGEGFSGERSEEVCGEILFCRSKLLRHARERKRTLQQEFQDMLIHAIAHIAGYDHETSADFRSMQAYQRSLQSRLTKIGKGKKIQYTKGTIISTNEKNRKHRRH